jgi:Hypothetical glycosyl hydrolase family 15
MQRSHPLSASRAGFVRGAGAALAFGLPLARASAARASAPAAANGYPVFGWEHVPYAAQIGKNRGDFTPQEAAFIAQRFAFIALGLGTGLGDKPPAQRIQELGLYRNARAIKAYNPQCKVLFYWGITGNVRNYRAYDNFDPAWRVEIRPGVFHNDDANQGFREWWAAAAAEIVRADVLDGVFIDGLNPEGDHPHHLEALRLLRARFDALAKPALITINGAPLGPARDAYLETCDGFMLEQFGILGHGGADAMKGYLLEMSRLGRAGKIALLRGWPSFTFMDENYKSLDYPQKAERARRDLLFPLAAFLCAAEPNCYLQYGWGWENIGGAYLLDADMKVPDPAWYPELLEPLGEPLGPPNLDGFVWRRQFRHAAVRADLTRREGAIDWS